MIQLRKKTLNLKLRIYEEKPVMRITANTQKSFIISKLALKHLKINVKTDALMFGLQDKKLHVFKEKKDTDNYHLCVSDTNTYRFRSKELYGFLVDFFKIDVNVEFLLELQTDNTFKLINKYNNENTM